MVENNNEIVNTSTNPNKKGSIYYIQNANTGKFGQTRRDIDTRIAEHIDSSSSLYFICTCYVRSHALMKNSSLLKYY